MTVRRSSATFFGAQPDQVRRTSAAASGVVDRRSDQEAAAILAPIVLAYCPIASWVRAKERRQDPLGSILGGGASGSSNPLNDMLNSMLGVAQPARAPGHVWLGSLSTVGGLLGAGRH